ncbi:NAD(P)/FAD-dependent oxidoreductase [Martelella alba]|uniref:NAD(P)/FAD-dependent oxidoreductase n=1 Tax=Martelella alba TaxID=2590451 RepID=A0A506UFC1_9HYPH|nr:NAD(P)-binding domain-containing protein [Martelella alba]TPW30507.1 NAD(P)/FAD-dependent oxidoreductase [Martelella alba]
MSEDLRTRLAALKSRATYEIECIEGMAPVWLEKPQADNRYNVVIVGAGLNGLSAAFALKRRGIGGVIVIDQSVTGREGPWITSARMKTLRSPKTLAGPDFGIPSLSPRAWYETVYGADSFAGIEKIARPDWMNYMLWFRDAIDVEIHNETRLEAVAEGEDGVRLSLSGNTSLPKEITCRHLILANGTDGCGGPLIPADIAALPRQFWTHSAEEADDSHLADKDVIVLGSATSSFDWAVRALEKGAKSVTMVARAKSLARTEALAWTNFPGYLGHYASLSDDEKWRFTKSFFALKVPPTQDQFDRACAYPQFRMEFASGIKSMIIKGDRLAVTTVSGAHVIDHILLGTGYAVDFTLRPELAALEGRFLRWEDRFTAEVIEEAPAIGPFPYLGHGFELTPKSTTDQWVRRVHIFNGGAVPSLGPVSNGITGVKYGIARIADGLTQALFLQESDRLQDEFANYSELHFDPRDKISA